MLCALIMAGGKGTRFWPLSTEERPKQFLNLIGEKTMLQMTIDRIKSIVPMERIFICTGKRYVHLIKEQLPEIKNRNIIIEPEARNTAPCIALSALIIKRYYGDGTMLVLPSDHLIKNEKEFRNIVLEAKEYLEKNSEAIVTLGIKPNRPETGYGYIKCSDNKININNNSLIKVEKFVEKPNLQKAIKYLENGAYVWNSGMFIWKISNIIEQIKKYSDNIYESLKNIEDVFEKELQKYINDNYKNIQPISIDYAVLEKSKDIYVIPAEIGWDDIGSWQALLRYREKDNSNNICIGNVKVKNSKNNLIVSSNCNVILNEADDMYIIENDGYIFVGKKKYISKINSKEVDFN